MSEALGIAAYIALVIITHGIIEGIKAIYKKVKEGKTK